MKPHEAVGWTLLNTSAVTAIVSQRVWHGMRPKADTLPSINFYEVGGTRSFGIVSQPFSVQCRAEGAGTARNLAEVVIRTLSGSSFTGITGTQNNFDIARGSLRADVGLISEPTEGVYNAPVDVVIVYDANTVS